MRFTKYNLYLIEFEVELAYGSKIGVTETSENSATNRLFDEVFHNQTIPGVHQIRQLSFLEGLQHLGIRRFFQVIRKPGIWYL